MKFPILLFLLTLGVGVGSQGATAHASACSNSTIRGSYAFTIHGTLFLPGGSTLVVDGIDKVTFDGQGNFTQVDAVATNGKLDAPGWRPGTGTYSAHPDCTGTQTIGGPGLPDLHRQCIDAHAGNTIHQVVIDPVMVLFAVAFSEDKLGPYQLLTTIEGPGNLAGGFDISWVDSASETYYLAERTITK